MLNKVSRKQRRSQRKIFEDIGIVCNLTPNKNIFITNAGLCNGVTQETILQLFLKYGSVDQVIMLPGKSYSFIVFTNIEDSVKAFESINGVSKIESSNGPLYLLYAETVPPINSIWNKKDFPPGLLIFDEFVTYDEENALLNCVQWNENADYESSLKNRQVKHYGYEFRYDVNNVDKNSPLTETIPKECNFIMDRLKLKQYNLMFQPDQLTVNKYLPGQGIPPHIDTHSAFEDTILSLSLGSSVVMEFRHRDGRHIGVNLPQRSLLVMSGEARYAWSHGITPRIMDIVPAVKGLTVRNRGVRISFTFRKVLKTKCCCLFPQACDTVKNQKTVENISAEQLENVHVHTIYDKIASHFNTTRHKPWPNVLSFVQSFSPGSILVDVGCGNGKYFGYNCNTFELGCDRSINLLQCCKSRGYQIFKCDCLSIPLRDNIADGVISIAVIHHLANEGRRLQAIKQIIRILNVGGRALIYVWAKNQMKDLNKSNYVKHNNTNVNESYSEIIKKDICSTENINVKLPIHVNRTQFEHRDLLVPWKLKGSECANNEQKVFLRYYHVFNEDELEKLCRGIKNIEIVDTYYDQGNWCIQIKKLCS